jgi:hypothetical protein
MWIINASDILFDMRAPTLVLIGFPQILLLLAVAAIPILGLVRPGPLRANHSLGAKSGPAAMLFFLVAILAMASLPIAFGLWARAAIAGGRTHSVQGCTVNFQRVVHPNAHGVADTNFSLAERDFHFSSSPWLPGFHNERDSIRPGEMLRMTLAGETVVRIERLADPCPRP